MPDEAFFLNSEDRRLIQQVLDFAKAWRLSGNVPPKNPFEEPTTSGIYIALTPSSGITALTQAGTGSSPFGTGDTPGFGICTIYQIVNGIMQALPSGLQETVYNFSQIPIQGFTWVLVSREKFGHWIASPLLTGGFQVTTQQHIAQGSSGTVIDLNGQTYTAWSMFGDTNHQVIAWMQYDVLNQRYALIQTPCPAGTGT